MVRRLFLTIFSLVVLVGAVTSLGLHSAEAGYACEDSWMWRPTLFIGEPRGVWACPPAAPCWGYHPTCWRKWSPDCPECPSPGLLNPNGTPAVASPPAADPAYPNGLLRGETPTGMPGPISGEAPQEPTPAPKPPVKSEGAAQPAGHPDNGQSPFRQESRRSVPNSEFKLRNLR